MDMKCQKKFFSRYLLMARQMPYEMKFIPVPGIILPGSHQQHLCC